MHLHSLALQPQERLNSGPTSTCAPTTASTSPLTKAWTSPFVSDLRASFQLLWRRDCHRSWYIEASVQGIALWNVANKARQSRSLMPFLISFAQYSFRPFLSPVYQRHVNMCSYSVRLWRLKRLKVRALRCCEDCNSPSFSEALPLGDGSEAHDSVGRHLRHRRCSAESTGTTEWTESSSSHRRVIVESSSSHRRVKSKKMQKDATNAMNATYAKTNEKQMIKTCKRH